MAASGPQELLVIEQSGMRAFSPRLPDPPEFLDALLQSAPGTLLFLALTTVSGDCQSAIDSNDLEKPAINMQFWMIDDSDLAENMSYITEDTEREVMALMLAAGQQAPKRSEHSGRQRMAEAVGTGRPWWRFW
jgi:hypothetical protein